ncbi:MAG: DUF418 domain-containing protein [Cellulomonas sp.]
MPHPSPSRAVLAPAAPALPAPDPRAPRWRFLDSLRGFALLGILLVNAVDLTEATTHRAGAAVADPVRDALHLAVQTRFVPIFELLFGMSLWFVLAGARRRAARAWVVPARRMAAVALIGAALMVVYPGNILVEYGVVGLLVLPVVALVPRAVVLGLGVALTGAAYALAGGGLAATPGLVLAGAGAAAYGLPRALETRTRGVALVCAAAAVLTVPALAWQLTQPGDPRFTTAGGVAGLVVAALWTTGLALLWRTPARRTIAWFFEPLGRMALSGYVGAAVVLAAAARVVDFGSMATVTPVVLLCVPLIVAQSLLSRAWLRRCAYGPVEWVLRCATWWRAVPLRADPAGARQEPRGPRG